MSVAFAPAADAPYAIWNDRSVSLEAQSLRASLREATRPPYDRGVEIYERVVNALTKAERQDGILITPQTFNRTRDFLASLPSQIPLPEVVVESESEIGLDWDESASRVLSLTVGDTPLVGFAGLFGNEPVHGKVVFAQEVPDTLRFFFGKLYPARRLRF